MTNPLNYPDDPILRDAFDRGIEAAEAQATWVADDSVPDLIRHILAMMEAGDPEVDRYLPARPDLSGTWADDPTPQSLARDVLGNQAFLIEQSNGDMLVDAIADAFEAGVSETFEAACERELRSHLS